MRRAGSRAKTAFRSTCTWPSRLNSTRLIARHFGREIRQVELLEEVGCLGPDVQAVACSDVSPREIELLAASGTAVLFDSPTRLFWGTGFPPIRDFLTAGVTCGVATNGAAANCGQDIFESMKYCLRDREDRCERSLRAYRRARAPDGDDGGCARDRTA